MLNGLDNLSAINNLSRFAPLFYTGEGLMLFVKEGQEGQGLMEYALVLVFVAIVIVAILTVLGPQVGNMYSRITVAF